MTTYPLRSLRPVAFHKLRTAFIGGLVLLAPVFIRAQSTAAGYVFTHLAGPLGGPGSADGPAAVARFKYPTALAFDNANRLIVVDSDADTLRRITADGTVSTLTDGAGQPSNISNQSAVAVDTAGNIFVADTSKELIYRITPGGSPTVFAGAVYQHFATGVIVYGAGTDGNGTAARFFRPSGLATDSAGNLYVADTGNHTIRKITPAADVTTLAGTYNQSGNADGTGAAARFSAPADLAIDSAGNLYVADTGNHTIRKITPTGDVTTFAGTAGLAGSTDGTGPAARFQRPSGITVDPAGNVYVAERDNRLIRRITPAGVVTTVAGQQGQNGWTDGTGTAATFATPARVASDSSGNVFVSDSESFTIRKITPTGVVSTFAALPGGFSHADGTGKEARFHFPQGIALDASGTIFVADFYNHAIRKITPAGVVSTLARTTGSVFSGNTAKLGYPTGMALDRNGNVFVANPGSNSIIKVAPDGTVSTFAGPVSGLIFGNTDGTGTIARFSYPEGITIDSAGTFYVADTGNHTIRKITPEGVVSTIAGTPGSTGSADGTGPDARFNTPISLAPDSAGNLYVADSRNHIIRKVTPAGVVTTVAGLAGQRGSTDGTEAAARFNNPCGVAVDAAGNIFVGDADNLLIRKIAPGGVVSTVGGKAGVIGSADGLGTAAEFFYPSCIALDAAGNLYVTDEFNHAIRKGELNGPPVITTQPLSQTVAAGVNVQLSVTATAVPTATYQWFFNGGAFSGATSNTLSFASARTSDAGDYTVVVTNALGSVTSAKATLTISSAPVTPTPPAAASGGGGAINGWFALAVTILALLRSILPRAIRS